MSSIKTNIDKAISHTCTSAIKAVFWLVVILWLLAR